MAARRLKIPSYSLAARARAQDLKASLCKISLWKSKHKLRVCPRIFVAFLDQIGYCESNEFCARGERRDQGSGVSGQRRP